MTSHAAMGPTPVGSFSGPMPNTQMFLQMFEALMTLLQLYDALFHRGCGGMGRTGMFAT